MSKTRKLYKIGDITKKLNITPRTIRYYDQLGLLPNVKRSDGDTRIFDDVDISHIEKTRYHQKTNFSPLFEIKSKLFPTSLENFDIKLITSINSKEKYLLSKNITGINVSSDTKELTNHLIEQSKHSSKKTLFIYFFDPEIEKEPIKLNLKNNQSILLKSYPLVKNGFTSHMILNHITHSNKSISTLEELDFLIEQFIDLSFSIGILDTADTFFSNSSACVVTNNIAQFSPVFKSTKDTFKICGFHQTKEELIQLAIQEFERELLDRKRYVSTIDIFSFNSIEMATKLRKDILDIFDKLTININEVSQWPFKGSKGITLTLI